MAWSAARQILDAKFETLNIGTCQIAWPNTKLPAQTQRYYAVRFIPTTVEPELYGSDHEKGIYQVSVFEPMGNGIGAAITAAQAVVDHFKRQNLSGVSCGVPSLGTPIQENDWWHVPVTIPFIVL